MNLSESNQRGMASILVTMVLMVVVSLIVLGFAQISRGNQRQALDNQLSKQAYYAAETGINDYSAAIRNWLNNPVNTDLTKLSKTDCTVPPTTDPVYGSIPDQTTNTTNVQYTCVLVNSAPKALRYSSISSTKVIPINSEKIINNLTINWQTTVPNLANPTANCPTTIGKLPTATGWKCSLGILRIDLVPITGSFTSQSLMGDNLTALLFPTQAVPPLSSSSIPVSANLSYSVASPNFNQYGNPHTANQGAEVLANCSNNSTIMCGVNISGLNSKNYYLRVTSLYQPSTIQIVGYNGQVSPMNNLNLTGTQILIDVTGKAQDILRRVQIMLPLTSTAAAGTFDSAIQTTQSLCKEFQTTPYGYYVNRVPDSKNINC